MTVLRSASSATAAEPATAELRVCCRERPEGGLDGPCTWPDTDCYENGPAMPTGETSIPVPGAWQHALDDLWGCIGKREMEHLQPETVRVAKENHETLWHNHDGPVCMADGLPWWHPHHFATVKSPNE